MTQPIHKQPPKKELLNELAALRQRVAELQEEKARLEVMLEMGAMHASAVEEDLFLEKEDLEIRLEMTTEHSDAVTEELHERAEAAVRKSERQLRMIVEATPAPVVISRVADGKIVYANALMGPLFGLLTAELLGREAVSLYYNPADRQRLLEMLYQERAVDRYEVQLQRADGTPLWVQISMRWLEFNDEPAILAALHNITHLKEQILELRIQIDEVKRQKQVSEIVDTDFFQDLQAKAHSIRSRRFGAAAARNTLADDEQKP